MTIYWRKYWPSRRNTMDYTKDHKNKVNSLLMEKWGYW